LGVIGAVKSGETMLDCPFTFCPYIKVAFTPEGVRSMHDIIILALEKKQKKQFLFLEIRFCQSQVFHTSNNSQPFIINFILNIASANRTNFCLSKIVGFVPDGEIWRACFSFG